ncbi:MAG: hypothetical protein BMS9Abin29_0140 [Gemmatimonadota bacterium]|nr:MAG: hypothetical protein BMS9Abin29_0140 [Gemmatimonadota bacterium]
MRLSSALVATAALLTLACSSPGRSSSPNARNRGAVISAEELATASELDAFDAVRRLRPMWLWTRGAVSLSLQDRAGVRVYINGSRRGQLEALKSFRATDIESITYLSAPEATLRFGIDHSDGAILVILKRGDD